MSATPLFETLHHVCIVVRDIDASVDYYASLGIGPWRNYPSLDQYTDLDVGDRSAFLRTIYKYADLANVQIQLCQPPAGDSPQRQFLETFGEGVFHLGFAVPDCDASESAARALGLHVLLRGRRPDHSGFTYFDTRKQAGVTLEIRTAARES